MWEDLQLLRTTNTCSGERQACGTGGGGEMGVWYGERDGEWDTEAE